jgi:hypothetical protein
LSQHGDRYAMVLEPLQCDAPILVEPSTSPTSPGDVDALALTMSIEDFARVSHREGYSPDILLQLNQAAAERKQTVSQFLWQLLESVGFVPADYRRALFERTGYTSSHYIPHPVACHDPEPALVFLAPGSEGSGSESVVPLRVASGMVDLLPLHATWQQKSNPSQIEYFSMCLLGEVHGLSFADVLSDLDPDSELADLLNERLRTEARHEAARLCAALGLSSERYASFRSARTAEPSRTGRDRG